MFLDLLGGGWRRTAAFIAAGILVAWVGFVHLQPAPPRSVENFSDREARSVSRYLESAYRDHASQGSMFVAVVDQKWFGLRDRDKRKAAEKIRYRMVEKGVDEILLYDREMSLIVHFKDGKWRMPQGWKS